MYKHFINTWLVVKKIPTYPVDFGGEQDLCERFWMSFGTKTHSLFDDDASEYNKHQDDMMWLFDNHIHFYMSYELDTNCYDDWHSKEYIYLKEFIIIPNDNDAMMFKLMR